MIRWVILLLSLVTAVAFAASPELRAAALVQLRSIAEPLFDQGAATAPHFDRFYAGMVESMPPQEKVEHALELAINRRVGAAEYVIQHAQDWRGQFAASDKLSILINTASDAPLIEVRMAAFEVYLAQYNLEKSTAQVDRLLQRMRDDPGGSSAWVFWNIGVLGARGVDRERIFRELLSGLHAGDDTLRRWAVDATAKFGGAEIVGPLLDIAAHEKSAIVRERAFCALAQSGTLLIAERYAAVPGLIAIADDAAADRQSVAWAYQALREITETYDLPDRVEPWRERLQRAGLL
ncbi:MAG: hypothetical protein ABI411_04495 [Tahibacter sp.]